VIRYFDNTDLKKKKFEDNNSYNSFHFDRTLLALVSLESGFNFIINSMLVIPQGLVLIYLYLRMSLGMSFKFEDYQQIIAILEVATKILIIGIDYQSKWK
jgi:hypothetical protein